MTLGETMSVSALGMERVLPLLRWKQTRRGYDGDDALLATAVALLQPDGRALDAAARELNVPAARVVTEVLQLALLLVVKPRHNDRAHARAVLHVLHLSLKALRRCTGRATTSIPMNACNLLLTSMAETLESCRSNEQEQEQEQEQALRVRLRAITDVHQVFVFLFGIEQQQQQQKENDGGPSFAMYKPPTNVYTAFLQRSAGRDRGAARRDQRRRRRVIARGARGAAARGRRRVPGAAALAAQQEEGVSRDRQDVAARSRDAAPPPHAARGRRHHRRRWRARRAGSRARGRAL
ncbi:hypothetical protein PINS_up003048 [Pythium insidiosum]|nr:hypothetical protein PINS_up003048 [Pythium insidiosum]